MIQVELQAKNGKGKYKCHAVSWFFAWNSLIYKIIKIK